MNDSSAEVLPFFTRLELEKGEWVPRYNPNFGANRDVKVPSILVWLDHFADAFIIRFREMQSFTPALSKCARLASWRMTLCQSLAMTKTRQSSIAPFVLSRIGTSFERPEQLDCCPKANSQAARMEVLPLYSRPHGHGITLGILAQNAGDWIDGGICR